MKAKVYKKDPYNGYYGLRCKITVKPARRSNGEPIVLRKGTYRPIRLTVKIILEALREYEQEAYSSDLIPHNWQHFPVQKIEIDNTRFYVKQ
jgi:hypothetical protein